MVAVLEGDQARLERAQHHDCASYNQRCPQHQMYPDGRREPELDPGGETDDNQSKKQDHENCWSVPGVLRRQVEAAGLASSSDAEKASKQPALAAARARAARNGETAGKLSV